MNVWLRTLCTYPTDDIDVTDVRNVDDWLDRAHDAGHYLFASSGTSGKSSFLDQSMKDREYAVPDCLAAFDLATRSEERRVGKECVRTCRSRWSPVHLKKNVCNTI